MRVFLLAFALRNAPSTATKSPVISLRFLKALGCKNCLLSSFHTAYFNSAVDNTDCKFIYKGVSNEDYIYEISSRY